MCYNFCCPKFGDHLICISEKLKAHRIFDIKEPYDFLWACEYFCSRKQVLNGGIMDLRHAK